MRPHHAAQQRYRARMGEPGRRAIVIRARLAVEARRGSRIEINRDIGAAGKALFDPRNHLRGDLRVLPGEMDDQWTSDGRGEVEPEIDAEPVIGNRAIDTGLGGGEAGELAAQAKAERTDFAGGFAAAAQRLDNGRDIFGSLGDSEGLGAQHDIPLGGVNLTEFAKLRIAIRHIVENYEPWPAPRLWNREIGAKPALARQDIDESPRHARLPVCDLCCI